jgi:hypothetical protein
VTIISGEPVPPSKPSAKSLRQKKPNQDSQLCSAQRHTRSRKKTTENLNVSSLGRRKDELLRQLGINPALYIASPKITPQVRAAGVRMEELFDVLRCDSDPDSLKASQMFDRLTPRQRSLAGFEGIALACGLMPRRLWELYSGALLNQRGEISAVKVAMGIPRAIDRTIQNATTVRGIADRDHLYKMGRMFPTPKGSTTTINLGKPQDALPASEETEDLGDLEPADDFLLKTARAMQKHLPAGS